MASGLFKKKQTAVNSDLKDLSVSEAALSQSTFNVEKITDIQNRFRGGEVLLIPGRIFIRDGVLWKVCRKGPKKRQFFLFNDVLVYGTILSRGHLGNQHIMSLSSMSVSADCHYMPQVELEGNSEDNDGSSSPSELKPENAFQVNHSDKSFHVYSHSKVDKANWITNINKQITKITKNRDSSDHVYQRAVWVPDSASKQCMICKQKFSAFIRKHHCRMCGRVVCSTCSPEKADIAKLSGTGVSSGKMERICKTCKKPVILVTGGRAMGSDKNDDIIEISTGPSTQHEVTSANDGEDSSETEDSDDSENEETPVPPPRRKKQQRRQQGEGKGEGEEEEEEEGDEGEGQTPPQGRPLSGGSSKLSPNKKFSKSPEQKKKSGPPPRPSYVPQKSIRKSATIEGDTNTTINNQSSNNEQKEIDKYKPEETESKPEETVEKDKEEQEKQKDTKETDSGTNNGMGTSPRSSLHIQPNQDSTSSPTKKPGLGAPPPRPSSKPRVDASLIGLPPPKPNPPKPDSNIQRPVSDSPKPDSSIQRPVSDSPKPDSSIQRPVSDSPKPDSSIQRPVSDSPKPDSSIQRPVSDSPKPDSSIQRPVPKPRRTIFKKDQNPETGTSPSTNRPMSNVSDNETSSSSINTNGEKETSQEIDPIQPSMEQDKQEENALVQDDVPQDSVPQEDVSLESGGQEDTDFGGQQEEDMENNNEEKIEQVESMSRGDILTSVNEESTVEQSSTDQPKEEERPQITKRRKQKITSSSEPTPSSLDSNTPSQKQTPESGNSDTDLSPQLKSMRSPSTHARQRRSKFSTAPQS